MLFTQGIFKVYSQRIGWFCEKNFAPCVKNILTKTLQR